MCSGMTGMQTGNLTKTFKNRVVCVQPDCLFRRPGFNAKHLAEFTVRALAGEPLTKIVSKSEMILARPQCIDCALRVMQGRKTIPTKEEWIHLDGLGHWHHRRRRRSSHWGYLKH